MSLASGVEVGLGGHDYWTQNSGSSWSLTTPDSDTFRFEVRSSDQWQWDPDWKERSELSGDAVYGTTETLTVSYSFMIEKGEANTADWVVIGQFHADDDTTSPPLAIEMVGEKMAVVVRYQLPGDTSQKMFYAYVDDSDIQRGKYYDIKITARFSNDDNGFVDVWRDGKQLVDYNGPLGYGYDVYWKHGIYREESKETLAVNYKNFSLTTDGGVVIVGTKSSDIVASNESPSGQPTPTDQGDLIVLKKGKDVVVAGAGDDKVVAGGGKDKIDGGDGNDILKGGKGKDIFTFAQDFGNDKIKDYKPNKDKIEFSGIFDDYKDMKDHWYKHKGSTVIDVDGDSVLISKVKPGKLDAHDFLFT